MLALKIINCTDSMMWYRDSVGQTVTLARHPDSDKEVYWSRESAGYLNIVHKKDAEVIEIDD
jgi:hypothetical protein